MKNFLRIFLFLLIGTLFIEITFKIIAFNEVFSLMLLRIFLFTVAFSSLFALFLSFLKTKYSKIIIGIYIFTIAFFGLIQLTFHHMIGNYMSLKVGDDGMGRIGSLIGEFFSTAELSYYILFIPFISFMIGIIIFRKKIKKKRGLKVASMILIFILGMGVHILSLYTLDAKAFNNEYAMVNDRDLYTYVEYQETGLHRLGLTRFTTRDIITSIFKKEKQVEVSSVEKHVAVVPEEPDYVRRIDDTEWQALIDKETNQKILTLDNYYINRPITQKNEYTGMFKDKNMIYILVEAMDMIGISEELTPTLYKMQTEGFDFPNHFTPKYSCTTGESEFISQISIVPVSTTCTPNTFRNNDYPTAVFELFNRSGYYSTSYHNYTDKYYSRTTYHKSMGSIQFYNRDLLKNPIINGWPSDKDMIRLSTPLYMNEDKFFTYMITSSTHFPYDIYSEIQRRHWDQVKDMDLPYKVRTYLAKSIELDQAMEMLLDDLEAKGKLEDTVIALFSDHHPLRMEFSYLDKYSDIDRTEDLNIDITPFFIYNSGMEAEVVTTINDTFDMLPTIANLFDLDYDPRYYFGTDIFSEDEHLAIFNGGSWISEKGYYNSVKGTFKSYLEEGEEVSSEYILNINNHVKNAFTISSSTLYENYYKNRTFN